MPEMSCAVKVFLSQSTVKRGPKLMCELFEKIKSRKCCLEIVGALVGESERLVVAIKESPGERKDAAELPPAEQEER